MTEFVWVNVWNPVPLRKFIEPVGQAIRIHGRAVVLYEQIAAILPTIPIF